MRRDPLIPHAYPAWRHLLYIVPIVILIVVGWGFLLTQWWFLVLIGAYSWAVWPKKEKPGG